MVRSDEHAPAPSVDSPARARLAHALDRDGVVAVRLMGSQARGEAGRLSDVDLGVWLAPGPAGERTLDRQLTLAGAAAGALGTDEIDLIVLNAAPPLLRHRAIRDGVLILERDRAARVRLEARALLDYLDTSPLRAVLARGLRERLAEDRFGRR